MIFHSSGLPVDYIASWQGMAEINLKGTICRFRILALDRLKKRTIFAIPTSQVETIKALPGTGLTQSEIQLLKLMADEVSAQQQKIRVTKSKHPAQSDIKQQRKPWRETTDEEKAFRLLSANPWLLLVIMAALDSQYHALKLLSDVPEVVYNFITTSSNLQGNIAFNAALCSINFTSAARYRDASPVEIHVRETKDLEAWRSCTDRLAVIYTATGSQLMPLLDEINERERIRYCGGLLPPPLPATIIVRCKAFFQRRGILDVELPEDISFLSAEDQDILRSMMANSLNRENARLAYSSWRVQMSQRSSYRLDPYTCWRRVLAERFMRVNFKDTSLLDHALSLLEDSETNHQEAEAEREQILQKAVALLSDTSRYEREITGRPGSLNEAKRLLDDEQSAVAFRYSPTVGNDKGRSFLAFTKASLLRLLARAGFAESLLNALLERCEKQGLLDKKKRSIKLGDNTFNAITFLAT